MPRTKRSRYHQMVAAAAMLAVMLVGAVAVAGEPADAVAEPAYLAGVKLIPRQTLFGNPQKASPRISPDAKRLAYLAPVDDVLNVWVGPLDNPEAAKPVTHDKVRGIRSYFWACNNRQIVYLQDVGGNENWHVYLVDLDSGKTTDLTPLEGVRAEIEEVSHLFPNEIVIGLNDRDPKVFDVYRLDLTNGQRKLVQKNTENFTGFVLDEQFRVRFGIKLTPDGGKVMMEPDGKGGWEDFMVIPMQDALSTGPVGFDKSGKVLYMTDSRDRNTSALTAYNLETGDEKVLAHDLRADVGSVLMAPVEHTIEAVSFDYEREIWEITEPAVADDFKILRTVADGDIVFSSQSLDNWHWIVAYVMDDGPVRFYDYDRKRQIPRFLFTSRSDLEGLPLVPMHPVIIKSGDGLNLVSYLSLPPNTEVGETIQTRQPLPMVLDVHGGPWARDTWGYNPEHQFWANRGYAVLSVNYRGSTGFGKRFLNAGNLQWGGLMQQDLVDGVQWAVTQGIADPKRVAIAGGSYGGYATLMGLAETPDLYACGVDICGPSSLLTLMHSLPPYWMPAINMFKIRVGDFETEAGRKFLEEQSPLTHADRMRRPLLIGQGANDPRVKEAEASQIVTALEKKNVPVTYVLFPDEGHGFARPPDRLAFYAVAEAFLADHLGGRYEPIGGAFTDSSITVPVGAADVPGLEPAIKKYQASEGKNEGKKQ